MQRVSVHPINYASINSESSMLSMDAHIDVEDDTPLKAAGASSSSSGSGSSPYARRARYRYLPSLADLWLPTSLCGLLLLYPLLVIYACCFLAALAGGLVLNVEGQWGAGVLLLVLACVELSHLAYGVCNPLEGFVHAFMHLSLPLHLALTLGFGIAIELELDSHYGWIAPAAVAGVWMLILLRIACSRCVHSIGDMLTVFSHWRYNEPRLVRAEIPEEQLIAPPLTKKEQQLLGESR